MSDPATLDRRGEMDRGAGSSKVIAHLTASPFFGGPERQMLGLATNLPHPFRTVFLSFDGGGRGRPFLDATRQLGFEAIEICHDAPDYRASVREVEGELRRIKARVLLSHGYKPDILGWRAARRAGIPIVMVSRGWTAETLKVRLNETLDRLVMRAADRVVCVSEGQAVKVRRAGVSARRVIVIRNAIRAERFDDVDPAGRKKLRELFSIPPSLIVGAAGRLSPEKGFDVLIEAARLLDGSGLDIGFVIFGAGPLGAELAHRIDQAALGERFLLAGFRDDLDRLIPHLDVLAVPSFTEGLPNVALEASAASVPVVATAVGGIPEVIEDGGNGYLVPPGDPQALSDRLLDCLRDQGMRRTMGRRGRVRIKEQFTFEAQADRYRHLFEELIPGAPSPRDAAN